MKMKRSQRMHRNGTVVLSGTLQRLLCLFIVLFIATGTYAQSVLIGKVTDAAHEPLIGATIAIEGLENKGTITDICFTISSSQYKQIMRANLEVTDLRRRSLVIDFVEQFRTAYNREDMDFLEDIFSDDALIITGKTVRRVPVDGIGSTVDVELIAQSKREYLNKLAKVFAANKRINVIFEDVKVARHGSKENIYGVKLVQHWNADTYSDKGYLFLLWDFKDESHPQIHVRAWQPFDDTPKDKVLGLGNFKVE